MSHNARYEAELLSCVRVVSSWVLGVAAPFFAGMRALRLSRTLPDLAWPSMPQRGLGSDGRRF